MKYKLINRHTGEERLCDKVTIDKFDYYVGNIPAVSGDFALYAGHITKKLIDTEWTTGDKKVIATNNPSINAPQVVDEVEELAISYENSFTDNGVTIKADFKAGYNKSQETHPFSEEDIRFMLSEAFKASQEGYQITADEIIQIWKEQPKVIYYNTIKQ